ncbi:unnamed protein product [Jaminaea pallidilutea]
MSNVQVLANAAEIPTDPGNAKEMPKDHATTAIGDVSNPAACNDSSEKQPDVLEEAMTLRSMSGKPKLEESSAAGQQPDDSAWLSISVTRHRLRHTLYAVSCYVWRLTGELQEQDDFRKQREAVLSVKEEVLELMKGTAESIEGITSLMLSAPELSTEELHTIMNNAYETSTEAGTSVFSEESVDSDYTMSEDGVVSEPEDFEDLENARVALGEMSIYHAVVAQLESKGMLYVGPTHSGLFNAQLADRGLESDPFNEAFLPRFYLTLMLGREALEDLELQPMFMPNLDLNFPLEWPSCIKDKQKLEDLQWAVQNVRGHGRTVLALILDGPSTHRVRDFKKLKSYLALIGHDCELYEALYKVILICQPEEHLPRKVRDL